MTANTRVRFAGNNLGNAAGVTLTASSALASSPASNALNPSRSKVWRPAGQFAITTANQNVYINDGANKTAAIAVASYTSGAALATAIQTALNSVSTNWTCSYSSTTFKFTIGRTSGTALLRMSQTTNAAWSTLGYMLGVDTTAGTGLAATRISNHTSEFLVWDLGTAQSITFMALIGAAAASFPLTSTATVKLYGNSVNSWTSPPLAVTLSLTSGGVFQFLDSVVNTYRYWRLEWSDVTNPAGPSPVISQVYLGDYDTLTTRNLASGMGRQMVDPSQELISEGGTSWFQTRTKYAMWDSMSIGYMNATDRRALEQLFYSWGISSPFFIVMDPQLLVSSDLAEMTRYVYFSTLPKFTHIKADVYSVSFAVKEAI